MLKEKYRNSEILSLGLGTVVFIGPGLETSVVLVLVRSLVTQTLVDLVISEVVCGDAKIDCGDVQIGCGGDMIRIW